MAINANAGGNSKYPVTVVVYASIDNTYSDTVSKITITCTGTVGNGMWVQSSGVMFKSTCDGQVQGNTSIVGNSGGTGQHYSGSASHEYLVPKSHAGRNISWDVTVYNSSDMKQVGTNAVGTESGTLWSTAIPISTYVFDVNFTVDGENVTAPDCLLFDMYLNNQLTSKDVNDFYSTSISPGTTYSIQNIRITDDKYKHISTNDSLSGAINSNTTVVLNIGSIHTVSYDANGGAGYMEPDTATYGEDFKTSKNTISAPEGLYFKGWYHYAPSDNKKIYWGLDGSGIYESGIPWKWTYNYDVTLYAWWTESPDYNITFVGNSGTINDLETVNYGKMKNVDFSLSNVIPKKYGYAFKYWLAKQEDVDIQINKGVCFTLEDTKLPNIFINRLYDESNLDTTDGWEILVQAPNSVKFYVPTWTLLGGQDDLGAWPQLENGTWERTGTEYIYNKQKNEWKKGNESTHSFNFRGLIKIKDHNNELIDYITHLYGYANINDIVDPSHANVSFGSLSKYSIEFYLKDSYKCNKDVTLYAQWEANRYDMTIYLNGAENYPSYIKPTTVTFGEHFPLAMPTASIPTKEGYEYEGLFDADGVQVYDKNRQYVPCKYFDASNNTYIHDGELVLYAHWKPLNLAYYKKDGEWVLCNTYVKDNGIWKPAIMNHKTENGYIR